MIFLNSISSGFIHWRTGGDILRNFLVGYMPEGNIGLFGKYARRSCRNIDKCNAGENSMRIVAQSAEHFCGIGFIEGFAENQWTILESSVPSERLGASGAQFKVQVPPGGKTTVTYTVETK